MKGGIGNLMKQAQQMQEDMQKAQQEIAEMQVQGESGAGLVKVIMNGEHEINKIDIDDSLVGDDKEMLEDLVAAAVNDANRKLKSARDEKLSGLAGGMNLPGGMKLPF